MSFWHFLQLNWPELLLLVRQHIVLVFISILVAVIVSYATPGSVPLSTARTMVRLHAPENLRSGTRMPHAE